MFFSYTRIPDYTVSKNKLISCFDDLTNVHDDTVVSFGDEWTKFNKFSEIEISTTAREYFDILPEAIGAQSWVLDVGCGTGRWTKFLSKRVRGVDAIDPSAAIFAADRLLAETHNVRLTKCSIDNLPLPNDSYDLVMSIGVLHHIPDTRKALNTCVAKAKSGGFVYVYLYYNLDNRGLAFKALFWMSNAVRFVVSALPKSIKHPVCDFLAIVLYMPWILFGRLCISVRLTRLSKALPLSSYQNKTWFVIRGNALDRFGTPLEQRFSRRAVIEMMESAGLENIVVSDQIPFYHAIGRKK